jgi:hypothetical protein
MADATFFSLGDQGYFVGTVGLINSLRLTGHEGEIVILDCGFTSEQRELLAPACTLVEPAEDHDVSFRGYLKLIAPQAHTSDLTIVIDSDVIVTGSLDEVVGSAARGNIVAYADPESDRWFAEWEQIFRLPRPPRRDVYVCSALVAFSRQQRPEFLERWWAACSQTLTVPTTGEANAPVAQSDQDALNAALMGTYPEGTVELRPAHEVAQSTELRLGVDILDARTLRCSYRGRPTLLLHTAGRPKPWIRLGARRNAYTTLLSRVLVADDVPIRMPHSMIPPWLKGGPVSETYLAGLHAYSHARRSISRRIQFVPRDVRGKISRVLP